MLHGLYFPKHNFNPRTPCGVRPVRHGERHLCAAISIHAPLAGCDLPQDAPVIFEGISIHAPLAGCDAALRVDSCMCSNFNPRTPCGVRPADLPKAHAEAQFQSTHPLRGATLVSPPALLALCISIHAPLAGCDFCGIEILSSRLQFQSTHPLRGATAANYLDDETILFQSTHPLRGATRSKSGYMILTKFQSTHPLRGATGLRDAKAMQQTISIHAPLAGCDTSLALTLAVRMAFQSTHPLRGATCAAGLTQAALAISIHAPLAGCDTSLALTLAVRMAFQSTHPLRGATLTTSVQMVRQRFQSTHPLRGATYGCGPEADWLQISIHAPLAGCDRSTSRRTHSPRNFNPRTPCGVRPIQSERSATML